MKKAEDEKREFVMAKGICFLCLTKGHVSQECKQDVKCKECQGRHNSVFHKSRTQEKESREDENSAWLAAAYVRNPVIRPIVPVIVKTEKKSIATYAMIDSAATSSAILDTIAASVDATITQQPCKLTTFDSKSNEFRDFTDFSIQPLDRSFTLNIKNALVGKILTTEHDRPPRNTDIAHLTYMNDVHFDELENDTIGVILDASFAWTWVASETRHRSKDEPIAVRTHFNWTLIGPANPDMSEASDINAEICLMDTEEPTLQDEIRKMFRHDFIMRGT